MAKLYCKIRGELNVDEFANDKKTYSEEKERIDLINYLLSKNYPKNAFYIEEEVNIGSKSSKKLRMDLSIKHNNKYLIVAEVKRSDIPFNQIDSAIEKQLKPVMKVLEATYGIFYAGNYRFLIFNDKKYTLDSYLPDWNMKFSEKKRSFDDLIVIKNSKELFNDLDLTFHSMAYSKEERYKALFQLMLCKYYDEQFNKEKLEFTSLIVNKEPMNALYHKAYEYYKINLHNSHELDKELLFKFNDLLTIVEMLESYSFIKSSNSVAQDFFMKFSSEIFDKIDMAQYYTPITIIEFMVSVLDIKPYDRIIDCAGGSGDFLTGVMQKYKNVPGYENIKENLFYWDNSKEACKIAFLNMVLNGDGKTNIFNIDSIENYKEMNGAFKFVITNPPFGKSVRFKGNKDVLDNYKLNDFANGELGVLFIERSMNLLKTDGILAIVLPSGYLNNKKHSYIREWILKKYVILGDVSFPMGAFKGADTGVKTDVIFILKSERDLPYNFFIDVVKNIGFDYNSKRLTTLYKKDPETGNLVLDDNNNPMLDNDLYDISLKIKQFAHDYNIPSLIHEDNNLSFHEFNTADLDKNYKIKPELALDDYNEIKNQKLYSLLDYKKSLLTSQKNNFTISKKTQDIHSLIEDNVSYSYIPILQALTKGLYNLDNKLKGWEIKKIGRAKQLAVKNYIYLPYLLGSYNKFFMYTSNEVSVVSNGFFAIKIEDEKVRLSFFKFLFTKSYAIQFNALATGQIQTNINEKAVLSFKFPLLSDNELTEVKAMVKSISSCLNYINN